MNNGGKVSIKEDTVIAVSCAVIIPFNRWNRIS